jgi:hypothetical protein
MRPRSYTHPLTIRMYVGAPNDSPPPDPAKGEPDNAKVANSFNLDMGPQRGGESTSAYQARINRGMQKVEYLLTLTAAIALGPEAGALVAMFFAGISVTLDAIRKVFGSAGAGPGRCVTDPPSDENDPKWYRWTSDGAGGWVFQFDGRRTRAPRNAFEAWIQPILRRGIELGVNCRPVPDAGVLLPQLVAQWNAGHYGRSASEKNTYVPVDDSHWATDDQFANLVTTSQVPGPFVVNLGPVVPPPVHVQHLHDLLQGAARPPSIPSVTATLRTSSGRPTGAGSPSSPQGGTSAPAIAFIGAGVLSLLLLKGRAR